MMVSAFRFTARH